MRNTKSDITTVLRAMANASRVAVIDRLAYEEGSDSADRELLWLIETGNQLVAAGGEA
jgi:hypothetical protein